MLFDIDHFKDVNDNHGHLAGDQVLTTLANLVKAHIRREDFLARYGGEEFMVILPEIDRARALVAAEKIRVLVSEQAIIYDGKRIPISVSVGVATFDPGMVDLEAFIKEADRNLYEAKERGRNRVVG
jgi:diguanylate cyclase (GGDEF)-like protein